MVFCVPVSLLAWGMWCAIVRPAFVRLLPPGMAAMMSESPREAPRSVAALVGLVIFLYARVLPANWMPAPPADRGPAVVSVNR